MGPVGLQVEGEEGAGGAGEERAGGGGLGGGLWWNVAALAYGCTYLSTAPADAIERPTVRIAVTTALDIAHATHNLGGGDDRTAGAAVSIDSYRVVLLDAALQLTALPTSTSWAEPAEIQRAVFTALRGLAVPGRRCVAPRAGACAHSSLRPAVRSAPMTARRQPLNAYRRPAGAGSRVR